MDTIQTIYSWIISIVSNPFVQKYWFLIALYGLSIIFHTFFKPEYHPKNHHFIPSYSYFVFDQGFRIYFFLVFIIVGPLYVVISYGLKVQPMPSIEMTIIACIPIGLGILYKMWMYAVQTYIQKLTKGLSVDFPLCGQCRREFAPNKTECPYCKIPLITPEEKTKEYYQCQLVGRKWSGIWIEVKSSADGMDHIPEPASLFPNPLRELFMVFCIVGCIGMVVILWNMVQGASI